MSSYRTAYGYEDEKELSRLVLSGGFEITSGLSVINSKADSFSTQSGALVVDGGLGIGKNLTVGNTLRVLCNNNGYITLGTPDNTSELQLYSRLSTDIVPLSDLAYNLGSEFLKWNTLWAAALQSTAGILIRSTSSDPSVGVEIHKLQVQEGLKVDGDLTVSNDLTVEGTSNLKNTIIDTTGGGLNTIGTGQVNFAPDIFNVNSRILNLSATDTTIGVSICTTTPSVPFFFGSDDSTSTFNGKFVLVKGDLEVRGQTTVLQSESVVIKDKNLELGYVDSSNGATATDDTADGGGITVLGDTDKVFAWFNSSDAVHPNAWGSSENIDVASGKFVRVDIVRGRDDNTGLTLFDSQQAVATLKNGKLGVMCADPTVSFQIEATDAMKIPVGSSAQRPESSIATEGLIRFNNELKRFEGFGSGDVWQGLGGCVSLDQMTFVTVQADDGVSNNDQIRLFTKGNQVAVFDQDGRLGIGLASPSVTLDIAGTDAIRVPVGNVAQRPATPEVGMVRYNQELSRYEGFSTGVWTSIGGVVSLDQQTFITVQADDGITNNDKIRLFTAGNQIAVFDEAGRLGIGLTSPTVTLDIAATDAIRLPVGDVAQRPATSEVGHLRYNSELSRFEGFSSGVWTTVGGLVSLDQQTYITVQADDGVSNNDKIRLFTAGTQIAVFDEGGRLGLGTTTPTVTVDIAGTDAVRLPVGAVADRPVNPAVGLNPF